MFPPFTPIFSYQILDITCTSKIALDLNWIRLTFVMYRPCVYMESQKNCIVSAKSFVIAWSFYASSKPDSNKIQCSFVRANVVLPYFLSTLLEMTCPLLLGNIKTAGYKFSLKLCR